MKLAVCTIAALMMFLPSVSAQTTDTSRYIVWGDVGYARTADDEGALGSGAGIGGGFGFRLTPRLTIQAVAHRVPYYRDVSWLTFDGRFIFAGVEAAFQSRRAGLRPFVSIGAGVMHDEHLWIQKTQTGPSESRETGRSDLSYTLSMLTASGGIDFPASGRLSIRAGVRFHGLLDTGDDLAPHTSVQPTIGAAWRW